MNYVMEYSNVYLKKFLSYIIPRFSRSVFACFSMLFLICCMKITALSPAYIGFGLGSAHLFEAP